MFIGGVFFLFNGSSLLLAENCSTVSFDGQGGGRVMTLVCYPGSQGAVPAWLAALTMVAIGITLSFLAIRTKRI